MSKASVNKGTIKRTLGLGNAPLVKGDISRTLGIAPTPASAPSILPGILNIDGVTIANLTSFNGVLKANINNINGVS